MKYDVKFACGHVHTVELFGTAAERERKIRYYEERGLCPDCYKAQKSQEMAAEHDEVEMFYGDYKRDYAGCKTKPGSYNAATKTIVVYVPRQPAPQQEAAPAQEEEAAQAKSQEAAQCQAATLKTIDDMQAAFTPMDRTHPQFPAINDRLERIRAAVAACASGHDLLACYGGIHAADPRMARTRVFGRIINTAQPANDTQRALLGL